MPLDPQAEQSLAQRAGAPRQHEVSPEQARAMQMAQPRLAGPEVSAVEDRMAPGPHGDVPVRVYIPAPLLSPPPQTGEAGGSSPPQTGEAGGSSPPQAGEAGGSSPPQTGEEGGALPVTMWFHGGGWVVGNVETNDATCRALANESGSIVVSVDYRLAPEHRFPIPFDDCYAATCWAAESAASFGGDPSRLAVAGGSAGGNLAAAVALRARDEGGPKLAQQTLVYPVTDRDFERPSYVANGDGYGLDLDTMVYFWDCYLSSEADALNPYVTPMLAEDLSGLPPAYVLTAEYDPLRDEGEEYAERLRAAGVPTTATRYDGMIHGFFNAGIPFDRTWDAIAETASELRKAFGAA